MSKRIFLDVDRSATSADGKRFVVVPLGAKSLDKRDFVLTEPVLKTVLANVRKQKNELPFMYEHGKGPRGGKAAGWFKPTALDFYPGEGLSVPKELARLTATAKKEIDEEEWGYISPGLEADEVKPNLWQPFGLFEASFTCVPVLDGQEKLAAEQTDEGGRHMDMKKLAKLAGLPEDATPEQIEDAIGKKLATPAAPPPPAPLEVSDALVTQLAERLSKTSLATSIVTLAKTEAEKIMEAERKTNRVNALLERGTADGKITTAERKATVDGKEVDPARILAEANPDAFEAYLAKSPRKVPIPGTVGRFDLTKDSLEEGKSTEGGAFSKLDLSEPRTRQLLHKAAEKLVAEKKQPDYAAATLFLTQPEAPTYSEQAQ